MSSAAPSVAAAPAVSNSDSTASTHVTVPKSSVDFFAQAAPRLHAYVRELQSENAALRAQNTSLRADAEILDGISDFLAEMSKSDLNYAQFMKLQQKQVEDEKRAAAAAAAKAKAGAGAAQTKLSLPPLKDVPPAAAAAAASATPASASASPSAPIAPAPSRSPRVRVSQKRPAPKAAGCGATWTFTAASGSNPALRHCTPYDHEYACFAKTRWIGRSILAVLCSDFKPPAAAAGADDDGAEGAATAAAASTPAAAAESYYRHAISSSRVLVNDAPVAPEYVLQSGDHIRQRVHRHEPPVPDFNASAEGEAAHRVRIISESDDLIVVDKPSGIPVHESGKHFHQSLLGILANQLAPAGSPALQLLPVHRLDKLTSGVVLLAKNPATAARLGAIIKGEGDKDEEDGEATASNGSTPSTPAGSLRKVYLARVNGRFPSSPSDLPVAVAGLSPTLTAEGFLSLSAPLRVISQRAGLHGVDFSGEGSASSGSGPKPAVTLFRALSYDARSNTSVVEVHPQTGRTHQIRLHLQHLGFPITNDPVYGGSLFEGNSYGSTGEGHPDPAVRSKQPGAWDASCADCVNQLYYAPSKDVESTRYCTGIWLHALSYSFTPAAPASASASSTVASAASASSAAGFSFSTAPVDWADANFDVVAALGKRVKATPKASDLLAAAAVAAASASRSSALASSSSSSSASASSSPPPALCIRASLPSDVAAITRIYAHHVSHGTASFEEVPPTEAEMSSRRAEVLSRGLPFTVATMPNPSADPTAQPLVVGFAYANLFRLRTAYRFTVENSIYLDPQYCARRGVGAALLRPLLSQLQAAGYRQVLAVIGDSANAASIGLHSKFGFKHLGTMERVGLKFGRWLDVVFMQLDLQQGDRSIPASDPKPCVKSNEGGSSS